VSEQLRIEARPQLGIAAVAARKGVDLARIGAAAGEGPSLLGVGPGAWLAVEEDAQPDFADRLQQDLAGLASVSDQSSAYAVLRLSGPGARTVLQRGASIDFHSDVFRVGSVAVTVIAHIGVVIWQVDDAPTYDVFVFRSFAESFRHWLDETAAAL
jgi:methylglutamate dehydrogenase subunit D